MWSALPATEVCILKGVDCQATFESDYTQWIHLGPSEVREGFCAAEPFQKACQARHQQQMRFQPDCLGNGKVEQHLEKGGAEGWGRSFASTIGKWRWKPSAKQEEIEERDQWCVYGFKRVPIFAEDTWSCDTWEGGQRKGRTQQTLAKEVQHMPAHGRCEGKPRAQGSSFWCKHQKKQEKACSSEEAKCCIEKKCCAYCKEKMAQYQ